MKSKLFSSARDIFQINFSVLFFFFLFIGTKSFAQSPEFNVKGEHAEKVRMNKLIVTVKVVGNIAYTTSEMHFFNSGTRDMEGELIFPLPENVSVSRYGIDINGKIRDAVPVDKNKGKQVFEAIEHRRVDPGLLEKVDGNNFRTRVYPIVPNGERIVIIGYEEELSAFDKDNLAYQLVSRYPKKLDQFEINVSVLGTSVTPTVIENSGDAITFSKWNQTFQASVKKENYQPSEKLLFKIPTQENAPSVIMQDVGGQHYFYGNTFVESQSISKKMPASIGLIWDNSLSCKTRDVNKELALLDAYFQKNKNTKVTLYFLNYTYEKQKDYVIANGNWNELKTALQNAKYDGGTRFSQINFTNNEEYFLFSDGLSSLSENVLPNTNKTVYTITSSAGADFAFLNCSAMQMRGEFLNLNKIKVQDALSKLVNSNLKFLGVKENNALTDLFPIVGTSVSGNFSFSGISLKGKNEITLLFGYDTKVILERKIALDAALLNTTDVNVEKLWAQKKIANLDFEYDKNEDEIESLGKKHGIVTKNTSLIVLEDILDYIAYDIIPPAELRSEFDKIKKREENNNQAQKKSNWKNVDQYFKELYMWWKEDYKYKKTKSRNEDYWKNVSSRSSHGSGISSSTSSRNESVAEGFITGIVTDEWGIVLPGVPVIGNGVQTMTDFDGKFLIKAEKNSILKFSYVGLKNYELNVSNNNDFRVKLGEESMQLSEIVVTAYNKVQSKDFDDFKEDEDEIAIEEVFEQSPEVIKALSGSVAGVTIEESVINDVISLDKNANTVSTTTVSSNQSIDDIEDEDRPKNYLEKLATTPKEKCYELYLELRKNYERNPSFYFDVAYFFYDRGDIKKALLVLSNIADLGLENHELYKTLMYTFREWNIYNDALFTARKIAGWRPHEPQSVRDYGLALYDAGKYQEALDQLINALEVNYFEEMSGQYEGVEDIILMDINRLIIAHKKLNTERLSKKYLKKIPVDIRIVMNWNSMDIDLDMHVIEPTEEKCYYGNRSTEAGARFSKDFTDGYGPEQYLIRNAVKGKYEIRTDYYSERRLVENGPATVMLEIYTTKWGKTKCVTKTIQMDKIKENEVLAEIVW